MKMVDFNWKVVYYDAEEESRLILEAYQMSKKEAKMPKKKIFTGYKIGDRVEAVREFGKTGITEGREGTIIDIYEGQDRPLIVHWDNHEKSLVKRWNYPYKDVRLAEFVPGEATSERLF